MRSSISQLNRLDLLSWKMDEALYGTNLNVKEAFELAYKVAHRGVGSVSPNPLVGCVVLDRNGNLIGVGAHEKFGEAHAEANAVLDVQKRFHENSLEQATVIVTLEPCAHKGKTPSCAKHLAKLPVKKVIIGSVDPDPRTAGAGIQILKSAHKEIILNTEFQADCIELTEAFHFARNQHQPFVALKVASDIEGAIANVGDQRHWITNEKSRDYGHFLRRYYDAILIGSETALLDNPTLDCRIPGFEKTPWRIVLDGRSRLKQKQKTLHIFQQHSEKTILFSSQADIKKTLSELFSIHHIQSILIEGGARTWASFINAGCVQKIHHFKAPNKITGEQKIYWNQFMENQPVTEKTREISLDQDILSEYTLNHPSGASK